MPISRRSLYRGRIVDFGIESIAQPDGRTLEIEVVRHPGGAAVVALDAERRVCLLRQFRAPFEDWLWELPAGKIDPPEPAGETARRELEEEAGLRADQWRSLGTLLTCPGFCDEVLHLYLATALHPTPARTEADEFIEVHWWPLERAVREAREGGLRDGKTVVALLRADALLASGP
ncbi:MAG: NUDIX hydrolase [Gammaproteobacteria bacterium]|nr:NUDIX hydrolase [Gammaproteobacteria bacterium]